jgi:SnoaL-like domain
MRLVAAWNSQDALAFSTLFTEEARYRGTDGIQRQGRAQIAAILSEQGPTSRVCVEGFVSVDVVGSRASATFRWRSVPKERGRAGTIDCVLVMDGGSWFIDVLLNTGDTPG